MAIQVIRQSAQYDGLGEPGAVPVPLSEPACQVRTRAIRITGSEDRDTGIWECSVGSFARQVEKAEVMHILAGSGVFTPEAGEAVRFSAGDTLFFPANTRGAWEIRETVRKVYVLL
ncbi:cupin domain-containing protein [Cupriavidus basilensis]|uniref:cupin domain-containing protein n=1 Tax=Cupriavidus basilensis TaxID=68895 RepID=UPI00157A3271|nr:cupin domain-containing protein [Cupriavidus basilensis]NUA28475.1 DUF861 domain-containing protein [Cupriavidus basilensis]